MCHDEQTKTRLISYLKINMTKNKQDRTCMFNSVHLGTAGRSCRKMSPPTSANALSYTPILLHLRFNLLRRVAASPSSSCCICLDLERASFESVVVGRRTAMTISPSSTSLCTLGLSRTVLPHLSRLLRRHAVLRFVFIWCWMYSAFVKRRKPPVRFTVNDDVVDSSIETSSCEARCGTHCAKASSRRSCTCLPRGLATFFSTSTVSCGNAFRTIATTSSLVLP